MFSFVLWDDEPLTFSTVLSANIKYVGKNIEAKYRNRWERVRKIIATSDKRNYLNKIEVSIDGTILNSMDLGPEITIIESVHSEESRKGGDSDLLQIEDKFTESTNIAGDDCTTAPMLSVKKPNDESQRNSEATVPATSQTPTPSTSLLEEPFTEQTVSTQGLGKDEYEQIRSETSSNRPEELPFGYESRLAGSTEDKVQLDQNYEVFVEKKILLRLTRKYKSNSKQLVRELMYCIVGKDVLKCMTPAGKSRDGIPDDVKDAIISYVNKNVDEREILEEKDYMRTLTLMCVTLRNPRR